jgi:hypothetical protein
MSQFRPRLSQQQYKALENLRADERRILVIGDLASAPLNLRLAIWSIAWTPTTASTAIK